MKGSPNVYTREWECTTNIQRSSQILLVLLKVGVLFYCPSQVCAYRTSERIQMIFESIWDICVLYLHVTFRPLWVCEDL